MTVETVDDFFANVAKEAAEKFPDLGIVVVGLQGRATTPRFAASRTSTRRTPSTS